MFWSRLLLSRIKLICLGIDSVAANVHYGETQNRDKRSFLRDYLQFSHKQASYYFASH